MTELELGLYILALAIVLIGFLGYVSYSFYKGIKPSKNLIEILLGTFF